MITEPFRTLYVDPGEDTGWCTANGTLLLGGGTTKMWEFADDVWSLLNAPDDPENVINDEAQLREGVTPDFLPIGRIVSEDFRIYPWKLKDLKFDRVRTARLIGALTFMARVKMIPFVLQGANIKAAARAAGAEELYLKPLHENRHHNDALQHYVFYTNVELMGVKLPIPEGMRDED